MKFTTRTLVAAALASVVSSAAIAQRATTLPASFGLEIVSAAPDINGIRVKYLTGSLELVGGKDAVFRGGADRMILDEAVHNTDEPGLEWLQPATTLYGVGLYSTHTQQLMHECGEDCGDDIFEAGGFLAVDGILHHLSLYDGVTPETYWALCGHNTAAASFWWDRLAFKTDEDNRCDAVQFKIVEL